MSPDYRFTVDAPADDDTDAAIVAEVLTGAVRDERNNPDEPVETRFARINADEVDFRVRDEGTLVLLWPISDAAKSFVEEKIAVETTFGGAVVVEHRYAQDIIDGIREDGLVIGGVS